MASAPYSDRRRGTWLMKYRPAPTGPWITVVLGKDPRLKSSRPPRTPPADLAARAAEFADVEYRAKHGLTPARPQPRPLAEYAAAYLEGYPSGHDSGSVALLRRVLGRFMAWTVERGVVSLQDVSDAVCRDYLESRRKRIADTTLKTERGYLSGLFGRAVQDRLIQVNPWSLAKIPKAAKQAKHPRFWSPDEITKIVAACRLEWHRDFVLVLANTGIRISAALAMEWGWIDWRGQKITVPREWNKGGFEYDVMLSDVVHDVLARRRAEHGGQLVFARPDGKPYSYSGTSSMIDRAIAKARVPHGTPHDLRHTFGRTLHLGGVPQGVISAMMGHSSLATTEIYTRMERGDAIAFMRRLALGLDPTKQA